LEIKKKKKKKDANVGGGAKGKKSQKREPVESRVQTLNNADRGRGVIKEKLHKGKEMFDSQGGWEGKVGRNNGCTRERPEVKPDVMCETLGERKKTRRPRDKTFVMGKSGRDNTSCRLGRVNNAGPMRGGEEKS